MNRKLKKIAAEAKKHSITLPEDGFFSEYYKVEKNYMGLFLKGDIIKIDKNDYKKKKNYTPLFLQIKIPV